MKQTMVRERIALACILGLEIWVFSASFPQFFNLDSLFYLIERPRSMGEFLGYLAGPDEGRQYRPLTLGLMGLAVPALGNQPRPYHWIPLLFHLANTLLLYVLSRRLLSGSLAVLSATAFWGLHSVAGWVTYDISYLSDFLATFLLLSSLLLALRGARTGMRGLGACSLIVFCLALLTKEAAVAFPLALWIALALANLHGRAGPVSAREWWQALRRHVRLVGTAFGLSLAFAGLLTHWLLSGRIYAQGPDSAYDINPAANLWGKAKYLFWAFNLPDALSAAFPAKTRALLLILLGIFFSACAIEIVARRGRLSAAAWGGAIWFAGLSLPALMLSSRLAKWYLYAPLLGFSLAFGVLTAGIRDRLSRRNSRLAPATLLLAAATMLVSSVVQTRSHIAASEPSYVSNVLQSFLASFRDAYPQLPPRATLLALPAFEGFLGDALRLLKAPPINHGELFEVYYPGTEVRLVCAEQGEELSPEEYRDPGTRVFQFLDGRIYDVTPYFREKGRMILHVLPTSEGDPPPVLQGRPSTEGRLYAKYVTLSIADRGARLPADYLGRSDIWILQYEGGRFHDVTAHYTRPGHSTLLLLPTLDGKVPAIRALEADPVAGEVLGRSRLVCAQGGEELSTEKFRDPETRVFQFLDGRIYDVTPYFREKGRMTLHVLPTSEGEAPPLLQGGSSTGRRLYEKYVTLSVADCGARLPADYLGHSDIWILQYEGGRFHDMTAHYMRPSDSTLLLLPTLDGRVPPIQALEADPVAGKVLSRSRLAIPFRDYPPVLCGDSTKSKLQIYQYLGGIFRDVTDYYDRSKGMTLFLLPTREQRVPEAMKPVFPSRCTRCVNPIRLMYADAGDELPANYERMHNLWIMQYINGHLIDVTDFYKGRRLARGRRIVERLEDLRVTMNPDERYPDYSRFDTPNGKPVFYLTPDREILTQIGGSAVTVPIGPVTPKSVLRFDVSWMHDGGDGAWAEALLRTGGGEKMLFREYMEPSQGGRALRWKEVSAELSWCANPRAELILRCTNEPGRNTVSDWLNWRHIAIEDSGSR